MAEREPETSESPDVQTVRQLVRLMHRFDLSAIDLTNERTTIRLRRWRATAGAAPAAPAPQATVPSPTPAAAPPPPAPARPAVEPVYIRSPMVGTFYESPAPDASPYVTVGSVVRPDTTVCLIEAMKVFTEINAGVTGTIAEVLVKSGQAVEFDQPLFRVEPS
ncbi:MAG: acetyl-CoA carboxylase, biotin carboxyl carrier protein [Isosphaeraceae bacterium]|jgi:acetyl-CoA carboxylase biotin carboxyl carrier protein|nr:MAG: acetyl-CoA carboxylase, biotin carboxyl carrier protein [Isosphaeraceae bacterium]